VEEIDNTQEEAACLQDEIEEAKARKLAAKKEEEQARREVERRKKAQAKAAAAAKKACAEAEQKKKAKHDAEVALGSSKAPAPEAAAGEAPFLHPDQLADAVAAASPADDEASEADMGAGSTSVEPQPTPEELKWAENVVALAKQEAQRAQRNLAMAEEVVHRTRAHSKGSNKAAAGKGAGERRESRDSLKGWLRPNTNGSGYVPPHLRDGYTPRPGKALPPGYHEGQRLSVGNGATRKKNYPAPNRAIVRPAGATAGATAGSPGTPSNTSVASSKSPGSVTSSPDSAVHLEGEGGSMGSKGRSRGARKSEPQFESQNVFAMLPEDDGNDSNDV